MKNRSSRDLSLDLHLIPLDMTLGSGHDHPQLNDRDDFVYQESGDLYLTRFSRQWSGWHADTWISDTVGLQYDKPGSNGSRWEMIWRVERR